ncbi:MAG: thioredoxin family protein [Thiotrichales bacterium]
MPRQQEIENNDITGVPVVGQPGPDRIRGMKNIAMTLYILLLATAPVYAADALDEKALIEGIDDSAKVLDLEVPEWFTPSFLNLKDDLKLALSQGKKGIIVYFGQKDCAYCEQFLKVNFGSDIETVNYTREHFNVIALDIWGSREVTDFADTVMTEAELAEFEETNFTPSFIFYTEDGVEALRIRGYMPPYQFRAAMEYVVDDYYKKETLRDYMRRANPPETYSLAPLNPEPFFDQPPYILDRRMGAKGPLAVFFEQSDCHACDILHSEPLHDEKTLELLDHFYAVQLDMWGNTPVITPKGKKLTAREWADELGIFFAPSIVFFDETGDEVFRVDSVVRLYRLRSILEYVLYKGYFTTPSLQRWRERTRERIPLYLQNPPAP